MDVARGQVARESRILGSWILKDGGMRFGGMCFEYCARPLISRIVFSPSQSAKETDTKAFVGGDRIVGLTEFRPALKDCLLVQSTVVFTKPLVRRIAILVTLNFPQTP